MKVKVIDEIMGSGKTTSIIKYMNEHQDRRYVFITPYLTEVKRVKKETEQLFIEPDETKMKNKSEHLFKLIEKGYNIATTHALFKRANDTLHDLLKMNGYTLILDEVMDVVETVAISSKDRKEILERYAHIDAISKKLVWDDLDYRGNHRQIMEMALNDTLFVVNNNLIVWSFPVKIFNAFEEIFILTYMFDSQLQRHYFDLFDIEYEKIKQEGLLHINRSELLAKMHIYQGKLNNIADDKYMLSSTWFRKNARNTHVLGALKNAVFTYFKNNTKTKSPNNGWTTFVEYKSMLKGKGYTKGFIPLNTRSSNDFREKTSMAYVANRFPNPIIKGLFQEKGINFDDDKMALSEMIQWLWRGCIRDNRDMNVYIPSARMRKILMDWMEEEMAK